MRAMRSLMVSRSRASCALKLAISLMVFCVQQFLEARHETRQVVAVELLEQVPVFGGGLEAGVDLGGFELVGFLERGHRLDDLLGSRASVLASASMRVCRASRRSRSRLSQDSTVSWCSPAISARSASSRDRIRVHGSSATRAAVCARRASAASRFASNASRAPGRAPNRGLAATVALASRAVQAARSTREARRSPLPAAPSRPAGGRSTVAQSGQSSSRKSANSSSVARFRAAAVGPRAVPAPGRFGADLAQAGLERALPALRARRSWRD